MVRGGATLLLVNSLLLLPVWLLNDRLGPQWLALEAVVVVGVFLALPDRRATRVLAWVTAAVVVVLAGLGVADTMARVALARPLNLYLDLRLASAVSNLLRGSLGAVQGTAFMAMAAVGTLGAAVATGWLLSRLPGTRGSDGAGKGGTGGRPGWSFGPRRTVGFVLVILGLGLIPARWLHPRGIALAIPAVHLVREQTVQMARMLGERSSFAREMAQVRSSYADEPGLFAGLGGRDVILAFIESYGMTTIDDDRYAPVVIPRLERMADALADAGIHVATGRLDAPSQGGMSWLGHGSMLSGLWLENQLRYDLLLASDRRTLVDDFSAAGYRTVAVMPAITLAWPEGARLGYDRIWAHADIPYEGPPLNWVTMPDQFTWSFLEETVRTEEPGRPLFAEVGLISSHAPWTPILDVLDDWDTIGNGAVFERWAGAGETPEELWLDTDRVREQYALAVGYAVDVLASYAARHLDERTLLIALGDHQPAPLITGEGASRSVPVHVMARDSTVLGPFLRWGFRPGTVPDDGVEARRMDDFREWFVTAFSAPASSP